MNRVMTKRQRERDYRAFRALFQSSRIWEPEVEYRPAESWEGDKYQTTSEH